MPKFSKKIQGFLKNNTKDKDTQVSLVARSANMLNSGDLIIFRYYMPPHTKQGRLSSRQQRVGIIVGNQRGEGTFISTQGNLLLSCFRLEVSSQEIIDVILEKLYKKRRKATYKKIIKSLKSILGENNYRTYKVSQLSEIYEVNI